MRCPECKAEMRALGPWPDYKDKGKAKDVFVCLKCCIPGGPLETVRVMVKGGKKIVAGFK